jgi:hypothetical protein
VKRLVTAMALLALATTGCTIQYPSEKQEVADLRPSFSFALADPNDDPTQYRILIDGLDMGSASNYVAGKNALKVLSGTHIVKVEAKGRAVVEERVYLGDGATRTILIPRP